MLKKLATITLLSGIILTSCKKKDIENPTTLTESIDNKVAQTEEIHVCVEKKLPASVQERTEAAIYTSSQWQTGQTIRIKFVNGDATLQNRIKSVANQWLQYANLKFHYVGLTEQADIRIGIKYNGDGGSWSYFGKECQYIPQSEPTMNFGWFTSTTNDQELTRTTLHEFGHALGLIHEQASPAVAINWNKEAVYAYYTGAPNFWTRADVDHNVFFKFSTTQTNYTAYDPYSIMHYPVPAQFTTDGFSVGLNTALSETDKKFIGQRYPFAAAAKSVLYGGEKLLTNQSLTSPNGRVKMTLKSDGNLVLLKDDTQILWSTNTAGRPTSQLVMHTSGNLVLYDNSWKLYWQTNTYKFSYAFLMIGDDGNASVYQNGISRWSTNTRI